MPLSILVAVANRPELRDELAAQLTADGHGVHQAHHSRHAVALLPARHLDVLILGALEHPAEAPRLLRELRAGTLDPRAWPARSPTRARPRRSGRWRPRPTSSTLVSSPSSRAATWCRRCTSRRSPIASSRSASAAGCTWSGCGPRRSIAPTGC
jgi:hypothetical protein